MKRTNPLIILLAGISVAGVLIGLGWQSDRIFGDGRSVGNIVAGAPGSPSVPPEAPGEGAAVPENNATAPPATPIDKQPVVEAAKLTGTWAGHLEPGTLAISAKNGKAIAYLCDGEKIESWFQGAAIDGKLDLKGADGATLKGVADKNKAQGKVKVRDLTIDFTIETAKKPSGLYRASANVRGAKVVGGWIVLKDGSQVGLGTVNGTLVKPSPLDVAKGTATVGGNEVTVLPAEDSP